MEKSARRNSWSIGPSDSSISASCANVSRTFDSVSASVSVFKPSNNCGCTCTSPYKKIPTKVSEQKEKKIEKEIQNIFLLHRCHWTYLSIQCLRYRLIHQPHIRIQPLHYHLYNYHFHLLSYLDEEKQNKFKIRTNKNWNCNECVYKLSKRNNYQSSTVISNCTLKHVLFVSYWLRIFDSSCGIRLFGFSLI